MLLITIIFLDESLMIMLLSLIHATKSFVEGI
jgi:hypothetical protein